MDAYQLRLECLRLAHEPGASPNDIVDRARSYSDFIFGRRDAEVLRAANELAKAVNQSSTD